MYSFPLVNEFVKHVGISYLRVLNAQLLRSLSKTKQMYVVMEGYKPVAVIISYDQYMEIQNKLKLD